MVISALYQAAGEPTPDIWELPFSDVNAGADYRRALLWAYGEKIVKGYDAETFAAFAGVSRQQLAVMLWRCADSPVASGESDLATFSDGTAAASWAKDALIWAVEAGLMSGYEDGTLRPEGTVTRAELAQILMNYLER